MNTTPFKLSDTVDVIGNKFVTRGGSTVTLIERGMSGRKFARDDGSAYWVGFASGAVFAIRDHADDIVARFVAPSFVVEANGKPIDTGRFDTLAEAKTCIAELSAELGWTGMRVVLDNGPRYNLSGKLLTGADAHEVVFTQGDDDTKSIDYTQSRAKPFTHTICDDQERYFFTWPKDWTPQQVADDFLRTYAVCEGAEPGPVAGWIEDADGNETHKFSGEPGATAVVQALS